MSDSRYAILNRSVLAITGDEAKTFLQGLISNDIEKARPDQAIYAAMLTPQGKCLFDFFIVESEADSRSAADNLSGVDNRSGVDIRFLLDVEAERATSLTQRLTMYKLRAKVDIADVSGDFGVAALLGASVPDDVGLGDGTGAARGQGGGVLFADPRLSALGARAILPKGEMTASLEALGLRPGAEDDYERVRFAAGVPEGAAELGVDKSPLLELGFEELQGVDFEKGCFVGQELTARMKYRGLVRKRLMPVTFEGEAPAPGTAIKAGSRDIGDLRSVGEHGGFAVLRLDKLAESMERGEGLTADDVTVKTVKPEWVNF